MNIQWPLVFFTVLGGAGAWLIAIASANELLGKAKSDKVRTIALITGIVLLVAGGIASSFHLGHVERIMGALSKPGSGIFTEALLTGLIILAAIVYLVMAKRGANKIALKVIATVAGIIGLVYPFVTSTTYMMASKPEWNTILFPITCFLTTGLTGVTSYLVIHLFDKGDDDDVRKTHSWMLLLTTIFSLASLVAVIVYVATVSEFGGDQAVLLWGGIIAAGSVLPLVCSLLARKGNATTVLSITALIGSFVGSFAFRCYMWLITASFASLLGSTSLFGTF